MVDWLAMLAGETRTRVLRLVRRSALSIGEISDALGITANAVRTHMAALERDGLVRSAGTQRSGGKPARLYELTSEAEELFPKAYALVLTELLSAVRAKRGEAAAVELLRDVGRRLGSRAVVSGKDGEARVAAAASLLESIGGSVEVERVGGGWRIVGSGCPLSSVVAESPDVCALAESLVAEATGLRVEERCERTGRPRCSFEIRGRGSRRA